MAVKKIPEAHNRVSPYLIVDGAARALEFYKRAFDAVEIFRHEAPGGRIGHAEVRIGDTVIMLADEFPEMPDAVAKSPRSLGGTTFGFNLYVEDVDARFKQAVAAGAKVKREVKNQFYGDRSGTVEDPFGHVWTISSHVEDVSPEEIKKRMASMPQG
jgi:PhnB protein